MDSFEGYVGIRLWDGQIANDLLFAFLLSLLILFAIVFRNNFQQFVKMLKDAVFVRERSSFFDEGRNESSIIFHLFMLFQAIFLCSVALFSIGKIYGYYGSINNEGLFGLLILFVVFLFYQFRQLTNYLLGCVFIEPRKYKLWKNNYNAIMEIWGILLYIPVLLLVFIDINVTIPVILFIIFYISYRFAIIYKTIRIFHKKNSGFLYISLYLCGQEILPLVFLYEGMVYLYNFIETSTLWH